jgi:hypothetical protein
MERAGIAVDIRRQPFLPRVLQNWKRLREWFDPAVYSPATPGRVR